MKTKLSDEQVKALEGYLPNIDLEKSDSSILMEINTRFHDWKQTSFVNVTTEALRSIKKQLTDLFEIAIELRKTITEESKEREQLLANIRGLIADYEGGLS